MNNLSNNPKGNGENGKADILSRAQSLYYELAREGDMESAIDLARGVRARLADPDELAVPKIPCDFDIKEVSAGSVALGQTDALLSLMDDDQMEQLLIEMGEAGMLDQ